MITQRTTFFPLLDHEVAQFSRNTTCTMESHRRRLSIDPASVESILSGGTNPPAAPPSPHVGNSPNRAQFSMAPPPRPAATHARPLSYRPRARPNRLSLSFPIAPSANGSESTRQTPTSSSAASFPPTPVEPTPSVNDPTEFLVALAGQERRVLELKEELFKAEKDLMRLKKQWATHEAHKKRAEIKHVEPMQPLQVAANGTKDDGPTSARQSLDMDRRKMLLSNINIPKEPRRKIITGGHTRTLSLLSPERSNYPRSFPQVRESSGERQPESMSKPSIMPDTSQGITRVSSLRARPLSYQGSVTHNAKVIAEDFKAGVWTFLEDLRQATVGDEAVSNDPPKNQQNLSAKAPVRKISRGNLRNDKNRKVPSPRSASPRTWETLTGTPASSDAAGWSDSDTPRPNPTSVGVKKTSRPISLAAPDLEDDWSSWDSPTPKSPRWSSSTAPSGPATPSHDNIDDRAVNIVDQSSDGGVSTPSKQTGDIQWPVAIDKLAPSNLRRTLSNAITDWERSLSPAQEQEDPLTTSNSDNHVNHNDEETLMLSQ
ncbi:hypothetical protein BJ875DRAFT_456182 [Amylocarpus encephaloides]|uniref:DUF4048 domain-containing protein n=1 Tax=Amylocarpus encephaloides TaxID=45428 RepID=A0A9P7YMS9_9HELO|nr:hypothetical protein BJ875DRAFT_456182 [Amylocarpus encephaloides]